MGPAYVLVGGGDLECLVDGVALPLGAPRNQKVVARLAMEAGRVVPVGSLVAAVWDHDPPATAARSIRNAVSDLRATWAAAVSLDPAQVIVTEGDGYRLWLERASLDSERRGPGGLRGHGGVWSKTSASSARVRHPGAYDQLLISPAQLSESLLLCGYTATRGINLDPRGTSDASRRLRKRLRHRGTTPGCSFRHRRGPAADTSTATRHASNLSLLRKGGGVVKGPTADTIGVPW